MPGIVGRVRNHDYRRTFASHALYLNDTKLPRESIKRWIGHADMKLILNVYSRDLPNEFAEQRGEHLDFSTDRYRDMPGFSEKLESVTRVTN